jgi:hypothetical protein
VQKADRGLRLLVLKHLDVGEPGGVVDADVDALVADVASPDPARVGAGWVAELALAADDPVAGGALDPSQLLDVDVKQLAGAGALVAAGTRRFASLPRLTVWLVSMNSMSLASRSRKRSSGTSRASARSIRTFPASPTSIGKTGCGSTLVISTGWPSRAFAAHASALTSVEKPLPSSSTRRGL